MGMWEATRENGSMGGGSWGASASMGEEEHGLMGLVSSSLATGAPYNPAAK